MAAKILLFDLETYPMLAEVWTAWEANALSIKRDSIICAFSAKWLGGKQITRGLVDYPTYANDKFDDRLLVQELWQLINEADIVIAQNGDKFDIKRMNARFIKYNLTPPKPYRSVDTLKVARRYFGFSSNKLNDLCRYLDIGQKFSTGGYGLWQGCMDGDPAAWRKMKKYNAQDVRILEKLYLRLRPWHQTHPNITPTSRMACPTCGSNRMQSRGTAVTEIDRCPRFQCQSCGGWASITIIRRWLKQQKAEEARLA